MLTPPPHVVQHGFATITADLLWCLPHSWVVWLSAHPLRHSAASLSLFFAWEAVSPRLPASWKEWGFPLALALSLIVLAATGYESWARGGVLLLLLSSLLALFISLWVQW